MILSFSSIHTNPVNQDDDYDIFDEIFGGIFDLFEFGSSEEDLSFNNKNVTSKLKTNNICKKSLRDLSHF